MHHPRTRAEEEQQPGALRVAHSRNPLQEHVARRRLFHEPLLREVRMPDRRPQHDHASLLGVRRADPRLLAELLHARRRLAGRVPDA
eukprot:10261289-Alexandrium_andersonii.AAC.1